MSDGDVSSKETTFDGKPESAERSEDGPSTSGVGGRFRSPSSEQVDGPAYVPDDADDSIDHLAGRFRTGPRLGSPDATDMESLDQSESLGGDTVDEDSLLDALDVDESSQDDDSAPAGPMASLDEPTANLAGGDPGSIPEVDVQPVDAPADEGQPQDEASPVCPSCHAENPPGMHFCVECGGSLEPATKKEDVGSLEGDVIGHVESIPDTDQKPPPPSRAAQEENPWDIDLVCINEDGTDGESVPLKFLETTVGREGDDRFPADAFLSPKHARFHIEDGTLFIEDLYSLNGTFIKLREETRLTPGDTILMGRQVLRFERFDQSITPKTKSSDGTRYMGSPAPGGSFKILQVGIGGMVQNVYCLPEAGAVLGREKGDIVFPHDKFMSGRHAQIYTGDDGHSYLVDLNSSNGTWIKLWEKTELEDGDYLFMGQQLFRVDYGD